MDTLIVLGHDRRKVIHFDITQNPTQVCIIATNGALRELLRVT